MFNNRVVTVRYKDPKYEEGHIFEAKRLPGAVDPPNVLAPENRPSNYRPQIGFNRDFPQASLGEAGHRFVNHHAGAYKHQQQPYQQQQRNYASIAPPNNYRNGKPSNCVFAWYLNLSTACAYDATEKFESGRPKLSLRERPIYVFVNYFCCFFGCAKYCEFKVRETFQLRRMHARRESRHSDEVLYCSVAVTFVSRTQHCNMNIARPFVNASREDAHVRFLSALIH